MPGLELPDLGDCHVPAAAVRAAAQVIVTFNRRDFPAEQLSSFDLQAKDPDDFLIDQYYLDEAGVRGIVRDIAGARERSVTTEGDTLPRAGARWRTEVRRALAHLVGAPSIRSRCWRSAFRTTCM